MMKKEIHPKYNKVKVTCSCGNSFETKSTTDKEEIHLEICSNCHPFYTGKQKIVDTAGRVTSFENRYKKSTKKKAAKKKNDKKKTDKKKVDKKTGNLDIV